jgi:hypothetical protein
MIIKLLNSKAVHRKYTHESFLYQSFLFPLRFIFSFIGIVKSILKNNRIEFLIA